MRSAQSRKKNDPKDEAVTTSQTNVIPKRKGVRSPAAAVEAKRSRQATQVQSKAQGDELKSVVAYCAAEQYRIEDVASILRQAGYVLDPFDTALHPEVVHFQMPAASTPSIPLALAGDVAMHRMGDVFVFPSGAVVAWNVEESRLQRLINGALSDAAVNPHPDRIETEDLDYYEDASNVKSAVEGDTLRVGTKFLERMFLDDAAQGRRPDDSALFEATEAHRDTHESDLAMTKIAFSSALARSTQVAVLESLLDSYFTSTQSLPSLLSSGARIPRHYNRRFILRKTGELLSVRAQLNLTELTDRVPDLFWDTRHELGLEGYFEQTGRALDLNYRIKVLNERLDYAREIADILREELHGRHGVLLEWLIIGLITVEVGFEGWKLLKEQFQGESTEDLTRRWLTKELGEGA